MNSNLQQEIYKIDVGYGDEDIECKLCNINKHVFSLYDDKDIVFIRACGKCFLKHVIDCYNSKDFESSSTPISTIDIVYGSLFMCNHCYQSYNSYYDSKASFVITADLKEACKTVNFCELCFKKYFMEVHNHVLEARIKNGSIKKVLRKIRLRQ